jgi:hypothetical protein
MKTTIHRANMRAAGYVLAAAAAFGGCGGPMAEGARPQPAAARAEAPSAQPGQEVGQVTVVPRSAGSADALAGMRPSYQDQGTDPLAMDQRMQGIVSSLSGDPDAVVQSFFSRFHRGGTEGLTVMDMAGRQPRTAPEALANGGDCTDLATFAVPILRAKGISGGVLVVHFASAPAGVEHMVPYVTLNGRETIVDLQAGSLGQTAQGTYTVVMRLTYGQAAEMYHREMGDYYRDHAQPDQAMASYYRALSAFDGDAYVHQNLGILLERAGRMDDANSHYQRAAQIDPAHYRRDQARGSYNQELQAAQQAMDRSDWTGCVTHLQNALDSGERISDSDRQTIQGNLSACRQRAGQ